MTTMPDIVDIAVWLEEHYAGSDIAKEARRLAEIDRTSDPVLRFPMFEDHPERHTYESGGMKDNVGKTRWDLLPRLPLELIARVLEFGTRKYQPNNWRYGFPWSDTWSSVQRHMWAWKEGEDLDKETGLSHLWHAGCQILFLIEHEALAVGADDRWKRPGEGELKT